MEQKGDGVNGNSLEVQLKTNIVFKVIEAIKIMVIKLVQDLKIGNLCVNLD